LKGWMDLLDLFRWGGELGEGGKAYVGEVLVEGETAVAGEGPD